MERVLLLSLFAMSIMNAAEEIQKNIEWEKFIQDTTGHEDPPFVAPSFCNTQQFSKAVNAMTASESFKKSEICTEKCPQTKGRFKIYCSICVASRAEQEKKKQ